MPSKEEIDFAKSEGGAWGIMEHGVVVASGDGRYPKIGIPRKKHLQKQTKCQVTPELLAARFDRAAAKGFAKAKWIEFCELMLARRFSVELYEARKTFSKYITVSYSVAGTVRTFKVRFSNHKPIRQREVNADC